MFRSPGGVHGLEHGSIHAAFDTHVTWTHGNIRRAPLKQIPFSPHLSQPGVARCCFVFLGAFLGCDLFLGYPCWDVVGF